MLHPSPPKIVYIPTTIARFHMDTTMGGGTIHLDVLINFFLQQQEKEADLKNKP
jgi:hypothetical protein